MKRIKPDINLQNDIQRDRVLDSLEYYKGKSFNYAHTWHTGIHYFNDSSNIDFVTYENVLLACKKSHLSSSNSVPVIIYDTENPLQPIGVKSEYWSFVLSGIVGTAKNNGFKVGFSPNIESLPPADKHVGEIFVVGPVGTSGNAYLEYIAIHTPSYSQEYTWELVGGGTTGDLSNYVTKEELNNKNYLTSIPDEYITEVELTKKQYVTSNTLSNYYTSEEIENNFYQKDSKELKDTISTIVDEKISDASSIDGGNISLN